MLAVDGSDGSESDDGSGPGFGPATTVAALAGVGYLLRRRQH
ncbi:PGF-CTERM sorting domain-containing protein [Halovenus sp. WSH3]|uniref:PGF-CTERM sorting domain-containing protein n=1 Tax=Halovenus carboxidivorans TaxID=2692199 RepID=A0A6B0T3M7_9EURY|nr:PGF-CTERM sorting domain-containing protein [Halovenus carboxidivorans]